MKSLLKSLKCTRPIQLIVKWWSRIYNIAMQRTLVSESVNKVGETVILKGWVSTIRDHGKISFLDLRDRTGFIQCVGQNLEKVTVESVVEIEGKVVARPERLVNPNIETGKVEIQIEKMTILSLASELPLPIDTDGYDIDENVRTKFRYLDLRRPRMARNIRIRSRVAQFLRNYLNGLDFVEIETPILTKATPEGARDFWFHQDSKRQVLCSSTITTTI